jgi:hypothetical protein
MAQDSLKERRNTSVIGASIYLMIEFGRVAIITSTGIPAAR